MTAIAFYFQVHQPYRMADYRRSDIGKTRGYFDDAENKRLLLRVAERCYRPMNALIAELIESTDQRFRCAFSLSGTVLRQLKDWSPETLQSFVDLAKTGNVEFMGETEMHSLASVASPADEFDQQIDNHRAMVADLFGRAPTTFRNTELVISNAIAATVERHGYDTLLGEGADRLLGWRSPYLVYRPTTCSRLKLLLRSYPFSDDIGFRFSNREWEHFPLFADTYAGWLHKLPEWAQFVGLFMDYETFGEHQWTDTGIFEFMRHLPAYLLEDERFTFQTPAEVASAHEPSTVLDIPGEVSWADQERDLTAWLGNPMQFAAHDRLYDLLPTIREAARHAPWVLDVWRRLSTSDQVYHMCTKFFSDGDVHEYFSPYRNPHDAFVRFMHILDDLSARVRAPQSTPSTSPFR